MQKKEDLTFRKRNESFNIKRELAREIKRICFDEEIKVKPLIESILEEWLKKKKKTQTASSTSAQVT